MDFLAAVTSGNDVHLCRRALFGFCKIVDLLERQVTANSNSVSADFDWLDTEYEYIS